MMLHKYWLETRTRFFAGIFLIAALCFFFVIFNPWILEQWAFDAIAHPDWIDPQWMPPAKSDFPYFIWHFLYNYLLQVVWVLFTVLLSLGGLISESERGSSLFTLALPVTRKRIFFSRVAIGYGETMVLSLVPCLVLPFSGLMIGKDYPFILALSHSMYFLIGGIVLYSIGILINIIIKNEFSSYLLSVSFVILFYFFFQPYADGMQKPYVLKMFDVPGVMAADSSSMIFQNFPFNQFILCSAVSGVLLLVSYQIIKKRDF